MIHDFRRKAKRVFGEQKKKLLIKTRTIQKKKTLMWCVAFNLTLDLTLETEWKQLQGFPYEFVCFLFNFKLFFISVFAVCSMLIWFSAFFMCSLQRTSDEKMCGCVQERERSFVDYHHYVRKNERQ